MSNQATAPCYLLHYLGIGVLAAEADAGEIANGQAAASFGRKRPFAVQRLVLVYHLAQTVGGDGDTAAQVGDHQI